MCTPIIDRLTTWASACQRSAILAAGVLGRLRRALGVGVAVVLAIAAGASLAQESDRLARGAYVTRAAGCMACHTASAKEAGVAGTESDAEQDGLPDGAFAGGRAFKTPFGVFYSPNITPDPETGIGNWTDEQFLTALRAGVDPDGNHYFPVFPFTSYTRMTDADGLAIKAYLDSLPPVRRANQAHDVGFPFGWRPLQAIWKMLFFEPGPLPVDNTQSEAWNRGRYLVTALAHCGECHTPRNMLGAMDQDRWLAGTADGPDGELVPNITPDSATGIGNWLEADIIELMKSGLKPNFDDVQGSMALAIEEGLSHLTEEDLVAIANYLKNIPAVVHNPKKPEK